MKDLSIFSTEELEDLLKLTSTSQMKGARLLSSIENSKKLGDIIYADIIKKKLSKYQRFSKIFYDELEKRERERERTR